MILHETKIFKKYLFKPILIQKQADKLNQCCRTNCKEKELKWQPTGFTFIGNLFSQATFYLKLCLKIGNSQLTNLRWLEMNSLILFWDRREGCLLTFFRKSQSQLAKKKKKNSLGMDHIWFISQKSSFHIWQRWILNFNYFVRNTVVSGLSFAFKPENLYLESFRWISTSLKNTKIKFFKVRFPFKSFLS